MITFLEKSNLVPSSFSRNSLPENKNKAIANFKKYINSSVPGKSVQHTINEDSKDKINEKNVYEDDIKIQQTFNDNFMLINNDIINMLQNMLNNQSINTGNIETKNYFNKQDLAQMVKDILGFDFINYNNLDLKDLSKKISDILNAEFSTKITPDEVFEAISNKDFQKALKNQLQIFEGWLMADKAGENFSKYSEKDNILKSNSDKIYQLRNNLIADSNGKESDENVLQKLFSNDKSNDSSLIKKSIFKEDVKTATGSKIEEQLESYKNNDVLTQNEFTLNNNYNKNSVSELKNNEAVHSKSIESNVLDQIIKNINISKDNVSSTIKIQLKPEFLGKVEINIRSVDGNIIASIITDSEKLKHQIETNIGVLSNQLDLKGIKIDSFNVTVDKNMQFTSQYNNQNFNGQQNNENSNSKHYTVTKYELLNNESFGLNEAFNYIADDHIDFKA